MFQLTKWYLDLVTEPGAVLIAYAAAIEWAGVRAQFAATLLARPGGAPVERTAVTEVALPVLEGDRLRWGHPGLEVRGEWQRRASPVEATLLDGAEGRLHWACLLPGAEAAATVAGEPLAGRGYAECLSMTCPPWTLPLDHLRWGRYVSAAHAAVWIAWRGGPPRQWTWLDGRPQPAAEAGDGAVAGLADGVELRIEPFREVCDRQALKVLSRHLPALPHSRLGPLGALRETKRLDRGILLQGGVPVDEGWVVHEVVSW